MANTLKDNKKEYNGSKQDAKNPFVTDNKAEYGLNTSGNFMPYKLAKQAILISIWIANGTMMSMLGPALPDLTVILGLNYEEIARGLVGTGIGALMGSITGGILCERFYKKTDMFMAISLVVGAIAFGMIPWIPRLALLFLMAFLIGFGLGLVNAGGNTMVMHLWNKNSGPPMYSIHFGFGLGGVIGPQIEKPFLTSHDNQKNSITTNTSIISNNSFLSNYTEATSELPFTEMTNNHLYIPFGIAAGINLLFSIALFIVFIIGEPKGYPQRKNASTTKELCSPTSCATGHPGYGIAILFFLFLFYFMSVGTEISYVRYIFAFATESGIGLNTDQAATLTSLFWLSHMGGRAFGIVISKFVPISLLIAVDLILFLIVSILLVFMANQFPIALWILTACYGFLCSPLFPAGMLWSNNVLAVNSMSVMICLFGASIGSICFNYIIGYTYEYYGPSSFMPILAFGCGLFLLIFGLMEFLARMMKRKTSKEKQLSMAEVLD